jgi:hypothetical protein
VKKQDFTWLYSKIESALDCINREGDRFSKGMTIDGTTGERMTEELRAKYRFHAAKHARETMHLSFTNQTNKDYIALKEMGLPIIPLLLEDIADMTSSSDVRMTFSFWSSLALISEIANPRLKIAEKDRGRYSPVREAYLKWGRANGYLKEATQ